MAVDPFGDPATEEVVDPLGDPTEQQSSEPMADPFGDPSEQQPVVAKAIDPLGDPATPDQRFIAQPSSAKETTAALGLLEERKSIGPQPELEFSTPEMQAQHEASVTDFGKKLKLSSPATQRIFNDRQGVDRYSKLQQAWAANPEQMPDEVRLELNELDRKHGVTTLPFEKRALAGRANNQGDIVRMSQYSTHANQSSAIDANMGLKDQAQERIERLIAVEDASGQTLPQGESFLGKAWYGLLGSAAPMAESIALAAASGGTVDKAYWAAQGQGEVLKNYVRNSGKKLTEMTDEEYQKAMTISRITGAAYAGAEFIGTNFGLQGSGLVSKSLNKLMSDAITDEVLYKKLVRGGVKFAANWMGEASEEGLQGLFTTVGEQAIGDDVDLKTAIPEAFEEFKAAVPATLGMVAIGGTTQHFNRRNVMSKKANAVMRDTGIDSETRLKLANEMKDAKSGAEFMSAYNNAKQLVREDSLGKRKEAFDSELNEMNQALDVVHGFNEKGTDFTEEESAAYSEAIQTLERVSPIDATESLMANIVNVVNSQVDASKQGFQEVTKKTDKDMVATVARNTEKLLGLKEGTISNDMMVEAFTGDPKERIKRGEFRARNITKEASTTAREDGETIDAYTARLNEVNGTEYTTAQVKEALGLRTKKEVSQLEEQMKLLAKGELVENLDIDDVLREEIKERITTGKENVEDVARDVIKQSKEAVAETSVADEAKPVEDKPAEKVAEEVVAPELDDDIIEVEPEVEEGKVTKLSPYKDVREAFIEAGGKEYEELKGHKISAKSAMLNFVEGDTKDFVPEMLGLRDRKAKSAKKLSLRATNKFHKLQGGRYNLFDQLALISGHEKGNASKIGDDIVKGEIETGALDKRVEDFLQEKNPKGIYTTKVMNTKVKVDTPLGKKHLSLGEVVLIDMAMGIEDNKGALIKNQFIFDDGDSTNMTEADYNTIVTQAKEQMGVDGAEAYNNTKEIYKGIAKMVGDMIKPTFDAIAKERGLDTTFDAVEDYIPIMLSGMSKNEKLDVNIPDLTQEVRDTFVNRELYKGKYHEREGGSKGGAIRLGNIDSLIHQIKGEGTKFAGIGMANDRLIRLVGNNEYMNEVRGVFGDQFVKRLREKASEAGGNASVTPKGRLDKLISLAFSAADTQRLSRISTQAIMASSLTMIRPYLNNKNSFKSGLKYATNKFLRDKLNENGFLHARYNGSAFSPDLAERGTKLKAMSGGKTLDSVSSDIMSTGDRVAISGLYASVAFDQMTQEGTGKTIEDLKNQPDAFWEKVNNEAARLVMKTQPSGTSAATSVWKGRSKHNLIYRVFTRYGSQGSRINNNVIEALDKYLLTGKESDRKQLHSVVEAQMVTNTLIISAIKSTRRATKISIAVMIAKAMGKDDDEIDKLKDKQDEELDKVVPTMVENFARTSMRSVEGMDDFIGLYDFMSKRFVDEPFGTVIGSELKDLKDGIQSVKSAIGYHKQLGRGSKLSGKELTALDAKIDKTRDRQTRVKLIKKRHEGRRALSSNQRKNIEAKYAKAVDKALVESAGFAALMARLPVASLKEIAEDSDLVGERIVKRLTKNKQ